MTAIKEHAVDVIQHAAATKTAAAVGIGGATTPIWVELVLNSQYMQAAGIVLGMILSCSIIAVNVVTIRKRLSETKTSSEIDRLREAILRKEAEDKGVNID